MSGEAPAVPRAIAHPSPRVPILSWWRGIYERVYVAPHPFYRMPMEASAERGSSSDEDMDGWTRNPQDMARVVKARAESIPWAAIHEAAAPDESRERVYRAIWLLSCLGVTERAGIALQRRIADHCRRSRIHLPLDDCMPENLEPPIGRFLDGLGLASVTAWDEFRDNRVEVPVAAFEPHRPPIRVPNGLTGPGVFGLHSPEAGLLLTWAFDGTEMLIAMTAAARARAKPEDHFEGWYADATTYSDVFNPREFLPRDE